MNAPDGYVAPAIGTSAFNCPLCGAYGAHSWSDVWLGYPTIITAADVAAREEMQKKIAAAPRPVGATHGRPPPKPYDANMLLVTETPPLGPTIVNGLATVKVSRCPFCERRLIWANGRIVWPHVSGAQPANPDLSAEVKRDYQEAASIVHLSPRGAAALLRLSIQKICKELGESGDNLNADIGSLVAKGLDPHIQEALDAVRVIGNEAVHPGEMDLKDDRATASTLFGLVNLIVEEMVSRKKRIRAVYEKLPADKLKGIEDRDRAGTKLVEPPPAK